MYICCNCVENEPKYYALGDCTLSQFHLADLFEIVCTRVPGRIALCDEKGQVSYAQMNARATRLAAGKKSPKDFAIVPEIKRSSAGKHTKGGNQKIGSYRYDHPVFTPEAVAAQARHAEISGRRRTYFCGAYWRYGFHEDGVVSALAALQQFKQQSRDEERDLRRAG